MPTVRRLRRRRLARPLSGPLGRAAVVGVLLVLAGANGCPDQIEFSEAPAAGLINTCFGPFVVHLSNANGSDYIQGEHYPDYPTPLAVQADGDGAPLVYNDEACSDLHDAERIVEVGQGPDFPFWIRGGTPGTFTLYGYTGNGSSTGEPTIFATTDVTLTEVASAVRVLVAPPSSVSAGQALSLSVEIVGDLGSRVVSWSGQVTLSIDQGPAGSVLAADALTVPVVAGVASFSNVALTKAGTHVLRVAALPSGPGPLQPVTTPSIAVTAGVPAALAFVDQPISAEAEGSLSQVGVEVRDPFANRVLTSTASITLAVDGGGTLVGGGSQPANTGLATWAAPSIGVAGDGYRLRATSPGLTAALSALFDVTPAAAARLAFVASPADVVAGAPLLAVSVQVTDNAGNLINAPTGTVSLAVDAGPEGGVLSGTTSASGQAGVAFFPGLSLVVAGEYTLRATGAGLSAATSGGFSVSPGSATELSFYNPPPPTATAGQTLPQVKVALRDGYGNLAGSAQAPVSLSATPAGPGGGSALLGTTTGTPGGGLVPFTDLHFDVAGTYVLTASAVGFAPVSAPAVTVLPGPAVSVGVASFPSTVGVGACSAGFQLRPLDAFGNATVVGEPTPVTITSSSPTLTVSTAPLCATGVEGFQLTSAGVPTLRVRDTVEGVVDVAFSAEGLGDVSLPIAVVSNQLRFDTLISTLETGACSPPVVVTTTDLDSVPLPAPNDVILALTADRPSLVFFADDTCTAAVTSVTVLTGQTSATFTVRDDVPGSARITAAAPGYGDVFQDIDVTEPPPPPAALAFITAPHAVDAGACSPEVTLQLQDAAGLPTVSPTSITVVVDVEGQGAEGAQLFADAACTVVAEATDVDAGAQGGSLHFRSTSPGTLTLVASASIEHAGEGTVLTPASQTHTVMDAGGTAPAIVRSANPTAGMGLPYIYDDDGRASAVGLAPLTFTLLSGPQGLSVDPVSGHVAWTPSQAGLVTVELRAENALGEDTYSFLVAVIDPAGIAPPFASFVMEPVSGPAPLLSVLDATASSSPRDGPLFFRWDFGDASPPGFGVLQDHTWALPGGYPVRLTVADALGQTAVDEQTVGVSDGALLPPSASIVASATSGEAALDVELSCACAAGSSPLASFRWDFGDGAAAEAAEVTHTFSPGGYEVRLVVTDENGLAATATVVITVSSGGNLPPVLTASAAPVVGTAPVDVQYGASVYDPDGTVVDLLWTFADGSQSAMLEPTRRLLEPGVWAATLTVTDDDGLSSYRTVEVTATSADGQTPPAIKSAPVTAGSAGVPYRYDDDGLPSAQGSRPLLWRAGKLIGGALVGAPAGLVVHPQTGEITWTPSDEQGGPQRIVLIASNGAGSAVQDWVVEVVGGTAEPGPGCTCVTGRPSGGALAAIAGLVLARLGRRRRHPKAADNTAPVKVGRR